MLSKQCQKNHNTTDFAKSENHVKPSELEYKAMEIYAEADRKVHCDVNLDTNPAYQRDVEMDTNPAYEVTN